MLLYFNLYTFPFNLLKPAYSFLRVFIPKIGYNGQKPMRLVTIKTRAKIIRIIANVPEITPVK